MLKNAYLDAKIAVDPGENEPHFVALTIASQAQHDSKSGRENGCPLDEQRSPCSDIFGIRCRNITSLDLQEYLPPRVCNFYTRFVM